MLCREYTGPLTRCNNSDKQTITAKLLRLLSDDERTFENGISIVQDSTGAGKLRVCFCDTDASESGHKHAVFSLPVAVCTPGT